MDNMTLKKQDEQRDEKNPVVIINLDRPRSLKFGHSALKRLGAMTGKALNNMTEDSFDLGDLEKVMYCGLLADSLEQGETLKLEDMEALLDQAEVFNDIIEAMNKALENAFRQTAKN
jgi:hypothetical protein